MPSAKKNLVIVESPAKAKTIEKISEAITRSLRLWDTCATFQRALSELI